MDVGSGPLCANEVLLACAKLHLQGGLVSDCFFGNANAHLLKLIKLGLVLCGESMTSFTPSLPIHPTPGNGTPIRLRHILYNPHLVLNAPTIVVFSSTAATKRLTILAKIVED